MGTSFDQLYKSNRCNSFDTITPLQHGFDCWRCLKKTQQRLEIVTGLGPLFWSLPAGTEAACLAYHDSFS